MNNTAKLFETIINRAIGLNRYTQYLQDFADNLSSAFPPYNIIVDSANNPTKYTIELAVAGFSREQLTVKIRYDAGIPILSISGNKGPDTPTIYSVKGLGSRSFNREFTMADDTEVENVTFKDGILSVFIKQLKTTKKEQVLDIQS